MRKAITVLSEEFQIVVSADGGLVRLTVGGPYSRAHLTRLLHRIVTETAAHGIPRALVDARSVALNLSTIARYEIGVQIADAIGRGIRVAMLLVPAVVDRFAETVARNRGATVRVFTDEAAALQWLGQGGAPAPDV